MCIRDSPSVPLSKKNKDIQSMIKVPIIFGIPKNWCIKAPLPASIIDALEIKYSVVIIPVSFPKILGLITCITSLYEFNLYKRLIFDIIIDVYKRQIQWIRYN